MIILVINCGSSSIKYQLFDMKSATDYTVKAKGLVEKIGLPEGNITHKPTGKEPFEKVLPIPDHKLGMKLVMDALVDPVHGVLNSFDDVEAVGHRIVQGADFFEGSCLVDDDVLKKIGICCDFAPLHNPAHLLGIHAITQVLPKTPQVVVFDTAFHQTMPRKAYLYGIPYKFYEEDKIRRYGAHGTSHRFVTGEAAKILGKKPEEVCLITAHLGNGSSCSAILNGQCVDTTMGFTPLEGLIMGTRSGSLDPAILFFISKKYGYDIDRLDKLVNKESGLLGLSGLSNDMRTLTQAASEGHVGAQIALETFAYRLTREIGGIAMALPRIDALVFTGGIGENSKLVRKMAMDNLKILGYQIDEARNEKNGKESGHIISKDGTPTAMVVATNEELLIALDTEALVK
mgnify:CR=1 FL=1